jgi:acyl-CoA thioesterase FadM
MVTAQLNVRYRKPVPVGQVLRLVGKAGTRKGRVSTATSQIMAQDGSLLAEAELVLVDIPLEEVQKLDPETFGWQVYPDEQEAQ